MRFKRLVGTYTALRRLYNFCALSGLCIHIRILRFKRLVYFNFSVIQYLGFVDSINVPVILILRFVDSSNVCATVVMDLLEDPSEGCDLQGFFANDLYVLIVPPCGSFFWVPLRSLFDVLHVIHCPTLTSDRLLLSNNITLCINITVHYARSV